jgi:protein involved in polysaccharide export with SLBB domain
MRVSNLLLPDNLLPEYYGPSAELTRLIAPDFHSEVLYFDVGKALAGDPKENLLLQEFDTVRLFSRWQMEEIPKVRVSGEVQRPGDYRLLKGMRVRDLVLQAGNVRLNALLKSADLVRVRHRGDSREGYRVTVDLAAALQGGPDRNLLLAPDDELIVRKAPLVPEPAYAVTVSGQVRRPGAYPLHEGMTVRDLLAEAGGPVPIKAYLESAEITRLDVQGSSVRSYSMTVNLAAALKGEEANNSRLAPYDELIVRTVPAWMEETDRNVTIKGEVRFPGAYPIYKGERLSSVLERAGGFTDKAYLRAAKFTRKSVQEEQQRRMDEVLKRTEEEIAQKQAEAASVASSAEELQATRATLEALNRSLARLKQARAEGRVVIHLAELERFKGGPYDVELQAGDLLDVPQSSSAVSVLGEVYNPTTLLTTPDRDVDYYLARAGGPTRQAEEDEMYVIRADGSLFSRQQTSFDGVRANWFARLWYGDSFLAQKLDAGDTVVVPRQIEKIAWMREIKDITQIISQVALTAGVLIAAGL